MYKHIYLQVWEDVNKDKFNIYAYRNHWLRGARRDNTQYTIDKTVIVLLIEASNLRLTVTLMICMVPHWPEPSHMQGLEDFKLRPNLVYSYRIHRLRGEHRLREDRIKDHTHVAINKTVCLLLMRPHLQIV